jgi:hypothetical protein
MGTNNGKVADDINIRYQYGEGRVSVGRRDWRTTRK